MKGTVPHGRSPTVGEGFTPSRPSRAGGTKPRPCSSAPAQLLRAAAALTLRALARASLLALAAWIASGAPAPALAFLGTWTALLLLPLLALGVLELPLVLGAGSSPSRAALLGAAVGLTWGLLALLWLSPFRALGALGPLALAAGGALGGALLPARRRSPRAAFAGVALLVLGALALAVLDPEGRYGERYAENRLSAEDLLAPAPFPGRDPASLSDLELARALAHTWMRTHPPAELRWSWEEAVALEGLLAYGEVSGDPEPARYAAAWVQSHSEEAASCTLWADAAAPAATALRIHGHDHPAVARVRRYLHESAPRTRAGCLSHVGLAAGGALPPQAWVDSLFMHGVFLNRLARGGDAWAMEESTRFGRAMLEHVADPGSGLMRHAWIDLGIAGGLRLPVEPMFWGRGNAWATWFLVDVQLARRARGLDPDPELRAALVAQLDALRSAQDPSGLWRTDLLGPSEGNPLETSASALFVAAWSRARRADLVVRSEADGRLLERARRALRGRIRWERGHPIVGGTSTGTSPFFSAIYRAVPLDENVGHGVGAMLLSLSPKLGE